jgi:hypothetical protein
MLSLASLLVIVDPIVSLDITAHLVPQLSCAAECRIVTASLQHVNGEVAAGASDLPCDQAVLLEHVPFGARLVPRVIFTCGGSLGYDSGPPVTIPPVLTNVAIDGTTVWVPALAEPRGPERIRLRLAGDGFESVHDFPTRELVLRKVEVPWGRLQVSATLEPYGARSNTRTLHRVPNDPAHVEAATVGCASTAGLLPLILFRRRRFPFPRGFW